MGRVGRTRREVDKEGLVGGDRFLLTDVADRLVGEIFCQVVALFRRAFGFDRRRSGVKFWVVLIVLAADESIEVFESGAGRPMVIGADRGSFKNRHLMTLA